MINGNGTQLYAGSNELGCVTGLSGLSLGYQQRDRTSLMDKQERSVNGHDEFAQVSLELFLEKANFETLQTLMDNDTNQQWHIGHSDGTGAPTSGTRSWASFTARVTNLSWSYERGAMVSVSATLDLTSKITVALI